MIPISDLRKGNLVRTNHGICPVHHICFDDIYVLGEDGRVLYAREVEGVEISKEYCDNINGNELVEVFLRYTFVHEMQNFYYWNNKKELKIEL